MFIASRQRGWTKSGTLLSISMNAIPMNAAIQQWVIEFCQGSEEAFAKLVRHYQNLVTSVAFANVGDLQRSEDLAQKAFLIAWQKKGELESDERFGGWVCGIVRNLARNDRRLAWHRVERVSTDDETLSLDSANMTPDRTISRQEQSELLWSTLEHIPANYREPMILYYREQHSVKAVAELLEISEDAVKQRLSRGRAMLKSEIEAMVEQSLSESTPRDVFAAGVLAAIPQLASAASLKAGASMVTHVGTAVATKAGGTKFLAGVSAPLVGAAGGILGGLLGLIGGLGGAWIGTRAGAKQATSEEERRLHWRFFFAMVALSVLYTGLVFAGVFGKFWGTTVNVALNVGFIAILVGSIGMFLRKQKQLHRIHGLPESVKAQRAKLLDVQPASRWGHLLNATAMLLGVWAWVVILSVITRDWTLVWISGFVLALQIAWVWGVSQKHSSAIQQIKFNGRLTLVTCCVQAVLVAFATWLNRPLVEKLNGVPIWAIVVFLVAIGVLVYRVTMNRAEFLRERIRDRNQSTDSK